MTRLPRCVLISAVVAMLTASGGAQKLSQFSSGMFPTHESGGGAQVPAPSVQGPSWFLRHYAIGTFGSTLGFGARFATSLTNSVNLRAGASYFSYTTDRSVSNVPYTANVRLQSEQAVVDWYPFHNSFHITPGVLFGNHNRAYGGATVTAGNTLSLNGVTYYSSSSSPVQVSGAVDFRRTSPMLTVGWGNWIRHFGEKHGGRHLMFPFEVGVAFSGDPVTALNYTGVVCTDPGLHNCVDIATDPEVQKNVKAEQVKFQNDANWARFYPIIAGGIVYRF